MTRSAYALLLVCLALTASGCTMCAGPFDQCGPVMNGSCGDGCRTHVRAGSALSVAATAPGVDADLNESSISTPLGEVVSPPGQNPAVAPPPPAATDGWKAGAAPK